jgi:hypothetical protein
VSTVPGGDRVDHLLPEHLEQLPVLAGRPVDEPDRAALRPLRDPGRRHRVADPVSVRVEVDRPRRGLALRRRLAGRAALAHADPDAVPAGRTPPRRVLPALVDVAAAGERLEVRPAVDAGQVIELRGRHAPPYVIVMIRNTLTPSTQ